MEVQNDEGVAGARTSIGSVVSLWRYPVKSMMGEELNASYIAEGGLLGDRVYALEDEATGRVVSAKNPQKWGKLFDFRASFVREPVPHQTLPPIRFALPYGDSVTSDHPDVDLKLSEALGARVRLLASAPEQPRYEEYWPDIDGRTNRDKLTEEFMPPRTFFDGATVHFLTTTTLDTLRALYPEGRFEARRFRPNIVIGSRSPERKFAENDWLERTLQVGEVALKVTKLCSRCVMTTLSQGDLPEDLGVLRTAARYNRVHVGAYATVVRGGRIRRGDSVKLLDILD